MSHQHKQTTGLIRLGCLYCDRADCDHIDGLPSDWERIERVQPYEGSVLPKAFSDRQGESCFDWQTHLGVCPDCRKIFG